MAAGTLVIYDEAKEDFVDGTFDWVNDNHAVALLDNGYTPATTHTTWADCSSHEVSDPDYGRADLGSESAVNTSGTVNCDAADVEYGPSASITARYAVILQGTAAGITSGSLLLGYCELDTGGDVTSTNGDFTIQWAAAGVFTVS